MEINKDKNKEYENLLKQYTELQNKYIELENKYKENTIIQSMNDMKHRYDELKRNTVSLYKYERLENTLNDNIQKTTASYVLVERILKNVKRIDSRFIINLTGESSLSLSNIESELQIVKDILQECLFAIR